MKLSYSATFSGVVLLIASAFTLLMTRPGLRIAGVQLPRFAWLSEQAPIWQLSWWLWLLFVFSWMVLLATFMWRYTPVHRVPTMLQNGLMGIAAILTIIGILVWMNLLPLSVEAPEPTDMVQWVDALALSFIGAGCFMAGIVTAWICVDLVWLEKLTWSWVLPGLIAGIALIPSPFLLPSAVHLMAAGLLWIIWCIALMVRGPEPKPFPELL